MRAGRLILITSILLIPLALSAAETNRVKTALDLSAAAVQRGEEIFKSSCRTCHSVKYLDYQAGMTADAARKAFGKAPPDLSLMAKAKGRGTKGAQYIHALLTGYNDTPEKNSVFPGLAMPPPFSGTDREVAQKANDVSAFLYHTAEPSARERKATGVYVLGYMAVLTALLYLLNRETWKAVK